MEMMLSNENVLTYLYNSIFPTEQNKDTNPRLVKKLITTTHNWKVAL